MGQGIARFGVDFDNLDKTYYAGEVVTGRVVLVLEGEIEMVGGIGEVKLKLKGKAKCYNDEHYETEVYFNSKQILPEERRQLPVGVHFYRFAVTLPMIAPSSFNSSFGNISYYARAKIDIPMALWAETTKSKRSPFTVINRLNFNLYPHLRIPYEMLTTKTLGCLCCASGPLIIFARLPKTGFAAYESIPITLDIDNASKVAVNEIHVNLIRIIRWKEIGEDKEKLQKLCLRGVQKGQSHTWSGHFRIPFSLFRFPLLDGCSIINLDHELIIKAVTSGMHSNLVMRIPITIADIVLGEESRASEVTSQN